MHGSSGTLVFSLTALTATRPNPCTWKLTQQHVTGSVHSEGYYKINPMDKKPYFQHSLSSFATPTLRNEVSKKEINHFIFSTVTILILLCCSGVRQSNRAAYRWLASVFYICHKCGKIFWGKLLQLPGIPWRFFCEYFYIQAFYNGVV